MSTQKRRKLCLATVFALALTGAAGAADLAVKAPIIAPVPVYSWTGIYIGISGGTGWGTKEYSYDQDATLRAMGSPLSLGTAEASHDVNGGFFGGQIGANWQFGWAVLGIQGDWYWANLEGKGAGNAGTFTDIAGGLGTTTSIYTEVKSFGSITGRIGAAFDRVLVYAKAGVAWKDADYRHEAHGPLVGGCTGFASSGCRQSQTIGQTRTGFTFGTGVELAVDHNWSAFLEYDFYDFDNEAVNYTFTHFGNTVSLPSNMDVTSYVHTIKAGINYRFNWWGARY